MIEITIDGQKILANENDSILETARKNGIFIPAICYLSGCSATLACKLCMVEIDGKRAYSCNAKPKEAQNILTKTPEIEIERAKIMESYCINHPLECGVCDKSGECELQDYTLMYKINDQHYGLDNILKTISLWGSVKYDPNLCIMCERCVTTCKDNLGESNIKALKQNLPTPDASYKESMPKDAFSVWNRKQKALIGFVGENNCIDCAECASVCPVGALGVRSFQYSTNAWELDKTSSTCALCPAGCKIIIESKINDKGKREIYRVSNDFNFNPICAGGRFAYDIYPDFSQNNLNALKNALSKAKSIKIGGNITNNEARFLRALGEKYNLILQNEELRNYSIFLQAYFNAGGENPAILSDIKKAKTIISFSPISYENPLVRYKINNTAKLQKDSNFIYIHPISDNLAASFSKNTQVLNIAPNSEIIALNAILVALGEKPLDIILDSKIELENKNENGEIIKSEYFRAFLDIGLNFEQFSALKIAPKPLFILGSDAYKSLEIASLLGALGNKIKVLFIPPTPNANGIISELDLSDSILNDYSIGFRTKGDFTIDSIECDYKIPFFHSLNDSLTNIDWKKLPLNAFQSQDYLNDLAKILDIKFSNHLEFLANDFSDGGEDVRGKILEAKNIIKNIEPNKYQKAKLEIQPNAYIGDLMTHFSPYSAFSRNLEQKIGIYVSPNKMHELGFENGDKITFSAANKKLYSNIYIDSNRADSLFMVSPQIDGACEIFGINKFITIEVYK